MRARSRRRISDLPNDAISKKFLLIATSSTGAKDMASLVSVNKGLNAFGNDEKILKALKFDNIQELVSSGLCWDPDGLFVKSARAGNQKSYDASFEHINELTSSAASKLNVAAVLYKRCIKTYRNRVLTRSMSKTKKGEVQVISKLMTGVSLSIQSTHWKIGAVVQDCLKKRRIKIKLNELKVNFAYRLGFLSYMICINDGPKKIPYFVSS